MLTAFSPGHFNDAWQYHKYIIENIERILALIKNTFHIQGMSSRQTEHRSTIEKYKILLLQM